LIRNLRARERFRNCARTGNARQTSNAAPKNTNS
jgi:hypothetical protein